jgi:hypothetical protein
VSRHLVIGYLEVSLIERGSLPGVNDMSPLK